MSIRMIVTTSLAKAKHEPPQFSADIGSTHQFVEFTLPDGGKVIVEARDGELQLRTPGGERGIAIEPRHSNVLAIKAVAL